MAYIQPSIVSDVASIKLNTISSSAYNSIQDPKINLSSESKSKSKY